MGTGLALVIGFLVGAPAWLTIAWVLSKVKHMGRIELNIQEPGSQQITRRYITPEKARLLKIDGRPASLLLTGKYRHVVTGQGVPFATTSFTLNKKNGLAMRINPKSQAYEWPTAYDAAVPLVDNRARSIAESTQGDAVDWAKWGAIAGGAAVVILLITASLVWQLWQKAQDAGAVPLG